MVQLGTLASILQKSKETVPPPPRTCVGGTEPVPYFLAAHFDSTLYHGTVFSEYIGKMEKLHY